MAAKSCCRRSTSCCRRSTSCCRRSINDELLSSLAYPPSVHRYSLPPSFMHSTLYSLSYNLVAVAHKNLGVGGTCSSAPRPWIRPWRLRIDIELSKLWRLRIDVELSKLWRLRIDVELSKLWRIHTYSFFLFISILHIFEKYEYLKHMPVQSNKSKITIKC